MNSKRLPAIVYTSRIPLVARRFGNNHSNFEAWSQSGKPAWRKSGTFGQSSFQRAVGSGDATMDAVEFTKSSSNIGLTGAGIMLPCVVHTAGRCQFRS